MTLHGNPLMDEIHYFKYQGLEKVSGSFTIPFDQHDFREKFGKNFSAAHFNYSTTSRGMCPEIQSLSS